MRIVVRGFVGMGLLAAGYVLGASGIGRVHDAAAQDAAAGAGEELTEKMKAAMTAVDAMQAYLISQGTMTPATKGTNVFASTVGGVNAVEDLETGRGVDPETFAALYAGRALPEIQADLSRDDEGRLLYRNKLVRIYPISRLTALFEARERLSGIEPEKAASGLPATR